METTLELIDDENYSLVLPAEHYMADHYRVVIANRLTVEA
jgi:hypothetical protein